MANPSLPSFVELMASLGLQDEHTANALLRGAAVVAVAADSGTPLSAVPATTPDHSTYRQSNASIDTPLVTPLSSPPVQRERPTSHGKKRYSPYGLGDIYTRRGSVPDMGHHGQDRRLHHLSAPEPYHDHSSNSGRATDEDGDEEMEDASSARHQPPPQPQPTRNYKTPNATLHCAGQPNLLISRQRIPRTGHTQGGNNMPRTKSHSHMRTTSITSQQQRPPIPSPRMGMDMAMDTERRNVNDEGDIAVISISSLLRRSHPQSRPVAGGPPAAAAAATTTTGPTPTVSLDSPRGFQFPTVVASGSTSESLRPPQPHPHRTPPSAPPTKTSFGFLPGASLSGNISSTSTSISAVRRARHARSSSARSVREMIRERESNVLLAPLHSFHPMGETEEEGDNDSLKPSESRIRHRSSGQESVHSTTSTTSITTTDDRRRGAIAKPPVQITSSSSSSSAVPVALHAGSHSSFLPLDDSSRSFSHRRRVKRHTADASTTKTTSTSTRTGGKRSSPPPPLMLPTLPISFNIRALVGGERERESGNGGDKDRLTATDAGYVSRREPHSPDPRGSWRRRVAPLEVAGGV